MSKRQVKEFKTEPNRSAFSPAFILQGPSSRVTPHGSKSRCRLTFIGGGRLSVSTIALLKKTFSPEIHRMLYTIAVILLVLWVLGLVSSYTIGGFIHILLVVAIVMILVNLISGRRGL
jgi:Family of unknown function (DUF5670)